MSCRKTDYNGSQTIIYISQLNNNLHFTVGQTSSKFCTRASFMVNSIATLTQLARWNLKLTTAKLHYIEPQGTGVNGSIYPRFKISHTHLFALIVAGPFTIVR